MRLQGPFAPVGIPLTSAEKLIPSAPLAGMIIDGYLINGIQY